MTEPGPRDPTEGPLAVLVALGEELKAMLTVLENRRSVEAEGGRYFSGEINGKPVVLLKSGIGSEGSRNAALFLIRAARPRGLIVAGFAGATATELRSGDLVVATQVLDPDLPRQLPAHSVLLETAQETAVNDLTVHVGRLGNTKTVLTTSFEKRHYYEKTSAIAVDMESLGAARAANAYDKPLLSVRVIIDDARTDLPLDFNKVMGPAGCVNWFLLLREIVHRPKSLARFADLQRAAHVARTNLATFIKAFVPLVPMPLTPEPY